MALLYGVVQTGFTEEVFFRGLIGGAAMRRFGLWRGNVLQSLIFLGPHLFFTSRYAGTMANDAYLFLGAMFSGWLFHQSCSFWSLDDSRRCKCHNLSISGLIFESMITKASCRKLVSLGVQRRIARRISCILPRKKPIQLM